MWLMCETILLLMVVKVIDDVFFVCSVASFFIHLKLLIHAIISLLEESDGWVQHHQGQVIVIVFMCSIVIVKLTSYRILRSRCLVLVVLRGPSRRGCRLGQRGSMAQRRLLPQSTISVYSIMLILLNRRQIGRQAHLRLLLIDHSGVIGGLGLVGAEEVADTAACRPHMVPLVHHFNRRKLS